MHWTEVNGFFGETDQVEYERLANLIPDGSILVEVGCFRGKSLASIADTIKRKKLRVVAIDIWGTKDYDEPEVQSQKDWMLKDFLETMRAFDLKPLTICWNNFDPKDYSLNASLVFIDGDHSYEAVKKDIATWWPQVWVGGYLAGHDMDIVRESWPGVKKAVFEKFDPVVNGNIWSVRKEA